MSFKGAHFPQDIILMGVRWYVAYPLSTSHVEELMLERGVHVDHSTINRWVVKYSPQLEEAFHRRKRKILTHLPDAAGQRRHADGRLGPHRVHQRVFGNQLVGVGHQAAQHGEGFGGQRSHFLAAPQAFINHIQAKRRKLDNGR